CYQHSSGWTF
nr:immunoglobulin light chain junction region [Macaca mulatta]MOW61887.1 immunoglobulin light chain junction region [Macaca mulatta]MOW61921.1 immunoglobulin light chain junction region [Macaca mulatta]MOW61982.1 immunoglobulin light chain junction region [Macaca mulatta]MOW62070.1 immunoglobulin light chain junction region [Macaca mulatta]